MPFPNLNDVKGRAKAAQSSVSSRFNSKPPPAPGATLPAPPKPPQFSSRPASQVSSGSAFSVDDKPALFNLLDSYFERRSGKANPSVFTTMGTLAASLPPKSTPSIPVAPPVNSSTRPILPSTSINPYATRSEPPIALRAENASEGETFAQFFASTASWTSSPKWFDFDALPPGGQPTPPPIASRTDVIRGTSWSYSGSQKSLTGVALFEDLSITWYHVTWSGTNYSGVRREAFWKGHPQYWSGSDLYDASVMYGDLVAEFAELAMQERRHVGRGECWDLANDGLKHVGVLATSAYPPFPKPMASIGRSHGHLIFSATAGSPGVWRGGDNAVRRGDIVQWLTVKIKPYGQPLATMTLGEPDHTAVIVADSGINGLDEMGEDGLQPLDASGIGTLEVVEQSARELPTRRTYDMSQFLSGKVSISFAALLNAFPTFYSYRCGYIVRSQWKLISGSLRCRLSGPLLCLDICSIGSNPPLTSPH